MVTASAFELAMCSNCVVAFRLAQPVCTFYNGCTVFSSIDDHLGRFVYFCLSGLNQRSAKPPGSCARIWGVAWGWTSLVLLAKHVQKQASQFWRRDMRKRYRHVSSLSFCRFIIPHLAHRGCSCLLRQQFFSK